MIVGKSFSYKIIDLISSNTKIIFIFVFVINIFCYEKKELLQSVCSCIGDFLYLMYKTFF